MPPNRLLHHTPHMDSPLLGVRTDDSRQEVSRKFRNSSSSRRIFPTVVSLIFVGLLTFFIVFSLMSMTRSNATILSEKGISDLNDIDAVRSYFGDKRLDIKDYREPRMEPSTAIRTRVVLFMLDGLRFDAVHTHPKLHSLLTEPSFQKDSVVLKLKIPLPSISLPGWLTTMTGSSPQHHGRTGNNSPQETLMDNVFRQAQNYGLRTGISGDSDWRILFTTSIQPLFGDGTRSPSINADDDDHWLRGSSYEKRDESWANIMFEAMMTPAIYKPRNTSTSEFPPTPPPHVIIRNPLTLPDWLGEEPKKIHREDVEISHFAYDFFMSYFEDIDGQGHSFGGGSERYTEAVSHKTDILSAFFRKLSDIDEMDEKTSGGQKWRTVVMVTSDHGHVDVGGHGGTARDVTQIPLVIFCNGSRLGQKDIANRVDLSKIDLDAETPFTSHDISATLSALLGIPVPRQSEGFFLPVVDHLIHNAERMKRHREDLSRQKKTYVSKLAGELDELDMTPMSDDAEELMDQMHEIEDNVTNRRIIRNFGISFGIWLTLMILMTTVSQCCTTVDFLIVFNTTPVQWVLHLQKRLNMRGEKLIEKRTSTDVRLQRLSLLTSLFTFFLYLSITLSSFFILFRFYRSHSQWRFDFTVFNSDHDTLVTILSLVLPGIAVLFLAQLVGYVMLSRESVKSRLYRWVEGADANAKDSQKEEMKRKYIVCTCQWMLYLSLLMTNTFLFSQAYQCVYLPYYYDTQFITPNIWSARFQSVCMSFLIAPLLLHSTLLHILYTQYLRFKIKSNHNELQDLSSPILGDSQKSIRSNGRAGRAALTSSGRTVMPDKA
ncbi:hypothetical protein PROFUN_04283 [Planoprotostelium fungivorum]|uniref:Uncharacterized protein n=1 Tax=Planoprotostelium fungivorum TaxID=1890364 RepID=A0A2P6NV22_9EUKA|nr:hypothetical protein PROFUN_04283 [Planoprotostelium fungivorum]